MAAPFLFGFGQAASVIAFAFGAMLLGLAFQAVDPAEYPGLRSRGLRLHARGLPILGGFAVGLGTGEWNAATFLVGVGAVLMALAASTRFSVPAGA